MSGSGSAISTGLGAEPATAGTGGGGPPPPGGPPGGGGPLPPGGLPALPGIDNDINSNDF